MAKYKGTGAPVTGSVADLVSRHLHKMGPMAEADLFLAVDFGCAPSKRYERLNRAIGTGWIAQTEDGKLDCSPAARTHYDEEGSEADGIKPIGQLAAFRQPVNVFDRPTLSAKHIPNRRGMRQDVPEWSVREKLSFKSIAGGDA